MSLKASYEVQSRRSVVERIIRKINEWRVLEDFRADQVAEFDAWLDCICALVNLRILAKRRTDWRRYPQMSRRVLSIAFSASIFPTRFRPSRCAAKGFQHTLNACLRTGLILPGANGSAAFVQCRCKGESVAF